MTWQKARVCSSKKFLWLEGREIWTQGNPFVSAGWSLLEGRMQPQESLIWCNLLSPEGRITTASMEQLELLGGPDAFCDDPPMIPFAEWSTPREEGEQGK